MASFVIHQTDERMFLLAAELSQVFPAVDTHIYAPNIVLSAKHIAEIVTGSNVIGGKADAEATALMNSMDITRFDMSSDEAFLSVNSRLTAEGALVVLLEHSMLSLNDLNALVIGFGRTGAALSRILKDVGVKSLTVASEGAKRPAGAFADKVIDLNEFDFSPYDAVFNTVPKKIIDDKEVLTMKEGTVYIDLASTPGLSLCFAKYIGIDAEIYPALPAKTAPLSAARAIKNYIIDHVVTSE